MMLRSKKIWLFLALMVLTCIPAVAAPSIQINLGGDTEPKVMALSIKLILLFGALSLAPAFLIIMTSFTRIIIIFSFLRSALGLQQMPPNQVLIGFALFLTLFTMKPVIVEINRTSLTPYLDGKISGQTAIKEGIKPIRNFMLKHTRRKELALFCKIGDVKLPIKRKDIPFDVLASAFITSEIKTAFQMGVALFIPFLVIDLVVASILTSMGMLMLPPVIVSLPFKILMFVLADGWDLVVSSLITSFKGGI